MESKFEIDMRRVTIMILVALFTISATNAQTSGNRRKMHTLPLPQKPKPDPISKSKQTTTTSSPTPPKCGYINGYEWIDLGLSVKWATCNVGASSPSDYGGYYAWGETRTKSNYTLNNCFDSLDESGYNWGIYKVGSNTKIEPNSGHDTARENWGSTWRMPTIEELEELDRKCIWKWISNVGHNGYEVTGPNGNSIFLPAAGYRYDTSSVDVCEGGFYWSSTLDPSFSYIASYLIFGSGGHYKDTYYRRLGLSVRPVTD
ncbi:MAG: hypothetical protein KBT15_07430 [Bacteroidales bacterium]|nr:hypothetical protein [Candidatus Minthousia equi]